MDLEGLSIESISAFKQSQIMAEAQVAMSKKANDQTKTAGDLILSVIKAAEPGKGGLINTVA